MPKTKFQNVVFTLMMSFLMVYAMICYNISMNIGGMTNQVFLMAFHEMIISKRPIRGCIEISGCCM